MFGCLACCALQQDIVCGLQAWQMHFGRGGCVRLTAPCRELMKHLSTEASKLGKLRKKLQAVEVWTRRRNVSVRLRRRIRSYYAEIWVRHDGAPAAARRAAAPGQRRFCAHCCRSFAKPSVTHCEWNILRVP